MTHSGVAKTIRDSTAKYIWPYYEKHMKEVVSGCRLCQIHRRGQSSKPHGLILGYVDRHMMSVGLDLFYWKGNTHLILMDHFLGAAHVPQI